MLCCNPGACVRSVSSYVVVVVVGVGGGVVVGCVFFGSPFLAETRTHKCNSDSPSWAYLCYTFGVIVHIFLFFV